MAELDQIAHSEATNEIEERKRQGAWDETPDAAAEAKEQLASAIAQERNTWGEGWLDHSVN